MRFEEDPLSAVDVSLSQGLFKKISMHLLEAEVLEPLLAPWPTGAGQVFIHLLRLYSLYTLYSTHLSCLSKRYCMLAHA